MLEIPSGNHSAILTAMLAPALLMTATASLLVSANARLARVVDRLRTLLAARKNACDSLPYHDEQIRRHRQRAELVLRACKMLYLAMGSFVCTSLALAFDALLRSRLGPLPTVLAVFGVIFLLVACYSMWQEVRLSINSFDHEMAQEMARSEQETKKKA